MCVYVFIHVRVCVYPLLPPPRQLEQEAQSSKLSAYSSPTCQTGQTGTSDDKHIKQIHIFPWLSGFSLALVSSPLPLYVC